MKYLLFAISIFFSQFAVSGSGETIIPNWLVSTHQSSLDISNITDNSIEVRVKLYDRDGSIVDMENLFGQEDTFIIDPKSTIRLTLQHSDAHYGFGKIYWSNVSRDKDDAIALLASFYSRQEGKTLLNQGLPF